MTKNINYFKFIQDIHNVLLKDNINKNIIEFFYSIKYKKEAKFLKLNNKECFCCNSIFCYYNWTPAHNIINIINEIQEIEFIYNYKNKYEKLKKIYNNNKITNLPEDIISNIFKHIIE